MIQYHNNDAKPENEMNKIDKTVLQETLFISAGVVILSALMNAVFLIIGKWDLPVLFGNVVGGAAAIINFFLMGLTVQSAVGKDEKTIQNKVKLSFILRELFLVAVTIAVVLNRGYFNLISYVIPLFFPRIAINFRKRK